MTFTLNDRVVGPVTPGSGVSLITIDFYFEDETQIEVYQEGVSSPLTISVDYTVTECSAVGVADGSITLTTPADGSTKYTIIGAQPLSRTSDLQFRGDLRSPVLNLEFDRLWMAITDVAADVSRAFKATFVSTYPNDLETLDTSGRAGKAIGFSADGTGLAILTSLPSIAAPGSTTDNSAARWDGAVAGGLQNSKVIILDSGAVSVTADGTGALYYLQHNPVDTTEYTEFTVLNDAGDYAGWGIGGSAVADDAYDGAYYYSDAPFVTMVTTAPGGALGFFVGGGANSNERMRINSTGVGIGDNNPSVPLHITGAAPAVRLEDTDVAGAYTELLVINGNLVTRIDPDAVQAGSHQRWEVDGTEVMRLVTGGLLGIGTNNPQEVGLHVYSSAPAIRLQDNANDTYARIVYDASSGGLIIGADVGNGVANTNILFTVDGSEVARFDVDGFFGVGVNPVAPIHTDFAYSLGGVMQRWTADYGTQTNRNYDLLAPSSDGADASFRWSTSNSHAFDTDGTERLVISNAGIAVTGAITEDVGTVPSGTTPSIDPINGTVQTWTLTGNSTPTDGLAAGEYVELHIDDGTAYTITWTSLVDEWVGGSAPTLDTTNTTIVVLQKVGSTVIGQTRGVAS